MNTPPQPLVSVVTPVFNEAEYLAECIESILAQTYQNWECIIVDNCSTDRSVEIARSYAAKDRRIRVHENQEFLRAIPNHNGALRQISPASKYCKMVLGDDWIFPECLERMVAVAEKHPSIGIVGAYALEGGNVSWTGLPYPSEMVPGHEICRRHFLEELYVFGSPTSVLYRADLVRSHDPFYNENNIHADNEVCFELLKASDFGFVHQVLTFTRVRPESRSRMSTDLHSFYSGTLHDLMNHGRAYLTPDELEACRKPLLADYYTFLGKSVLQRRDPKFWEYHKNKLNELGGGYSRVRVLRGMLLAIGNAALDPRHSAEKLFGAGDKPGSPRRKGKSGRNRPTLSVKETSNS
jgi:glycosyltransferase involved in cell wall biosynthesis